MDTEQQIRLNFLDEAEGYFDLMESNLLGLASTSIESSTVDSILRSAHSIKGGAGMMSFTNLSQVAHRLEDFFKILRVRYVGEVIEVEIETLLLQSVDYLRNLANLERQQLSTNDTTNNHEQQAIRDRLEPILSQLRSYLGDLEAGDENALLSQDEDFDPAVLIFEEGVDGVLDRFEGQLSALSLEELAQELSTTAQELIGFGNMANLDAFIELCESIQQQASSISPPEIANLAQQALKTWRRSHALVIRGSIEKLPSCLEIDAVNLLNLSPTENLELDRPEILNDLTSKEDFASLPSDTQDLSELQSAFDLDLPAEDNPISVPEQEVRDLSELQSAFDLDLPAEDNSISVPESEVRDLSELQSAFDLDLPAEDNSISVPEQEVLDLSELQSAFDLDLPAEDGDNITALDLNSLDLTELQSAFDSEEEISQPIPSKTTESTKPVALPKASAMQRAEEMVRVPVSQLRQFNTLFEQLVLNRNSIGLRLDQLQNIVALMGKRMLQMEYSNTQLRQWYDRASVEGLLSEKEQLVSASVNLDTRQQDSFDSLEMDRYSDIHLICQEQIETIVQLQEVATDITLGVKEVHQSVRELYYTTKSMQGNVTRTQMQPFSEVVKRFPRVIRDLSLQFNKKVNLEISGETTLLDRSVIEVLGDPLMHLLRNSFDHGIEDAQARLAAGKPESGNISIQANNLGTYSIITLKDDGGGISIDKIRDRVYQMGLERSEIAQIPEAELLNFIFEPGFSTAKEVTELSGRGVGMDVVKTNLEAIRGDITVNTKPGIGTTFTLRIPFTLSILRVAIVEQGKLIFAIPADSIRELIPTKPELMLAPGKERYVAWNQTEIPLIKIDEVLPYTSSRHTTSFTGNPTIDRSITLVVGNNNSFAALKLSRFWNEQESTIRTIDSPIPLPPGVISSVVFGDGKVIPLIDPLALVDANIGDRYSEENSGKALNRLAEDRSGFDSGANMLETSDLPTIKTILVVDDSINVRRYLSLTLEKAGYRVEQAKDGREAVDKILAGLAPQGVVCDIEMPRLDGYGVLEEIKERSEFKDLPIAMLTSRSNEKHRKLAFNLGASAYFSKPYNEQKLLDKLAEIIK